MDKTLEARNDEDQELHESPGSGAIATIKDVGIDPHVVAYFDRRSPISAQYRKLCTNLLKLDRANPPRSILITSSVPGEGNSITALNLGVTLADAPESRVVVVDANMRDPSLHRLMGMDNKSGLADYLAGEAVLGRLIRPTALANLSILTAGRLCGNPTKLLSCTRLSDLIRRLAVEFDHVVIDTPPVVSFSDAAVMAPSADGVLLVVNMGETSRKDAAQAHFLLRRVDSRILGAVLTHMVPGQDA